MTDSDGDVWFATSNGISCFDRSAKKWINYLSSFAKDSKNDNHIFTSLCEYKTGEILAGGYMSGIYRINKIAKQPTMQSDLHQIMMKHLTNI